MPTMIIGKRTQEMRLVVIDLLPSLLEVVVPFLLVMTVLFCLIVGAAEIASDTVEAIRGSLETGDCPPHGAPG